MLYEIAHAEPRPDHTVAITFSDGMSAVVDFSPVIERGELFATLADARFFVREMKVLPGGIGLAWSDELDFSADGLRRDASPREQEVEEDRTAHA